MNTAMNIGQSGSQSGAQSSGYSSGYGGTYGQAHDQPHSRGSICSNATSRTFLALAGGAGLGALTMYLLDPEQGRQRRHHTAELASSALSGTASALGSTWERSKEIASHVGEATAAGASAFRQKLSDSAESVGDYVGDSRIARGIGRGAGRFRSEASDRAGYLMHGNRSTGFINSGLGQTLCAAGCLALGVTTMYYFDPQDGARRRNTCRDQFLSGFNRMARSIDRLGRHLFNQATGLAHETRAHLSRQEVDDRVIVDRVRSGIGHCVSNVGAVQVESRNGCVTLTGHVLASEADALLKCAWGVRGVTEIINQLQIRPYDGPQHASSSATATTPSMM